MSTPKSESDTIQQIAPILAQIEGLSSQARMELQTTSQRDLKQIPVRMLQILSELSRVGIEPPPSYIQDQFKFASGPWETCPDCGHPAYNPDTKTCFVCAAESYPYGKGPFPSPEFKRRWERQPKVPIHAPTGQPLKTDLANAKVSVEASEKQKAQGVCSVNVEVPVSESPPSKIIAHGHTYILVPMCKGCNMPLKITGWVCPRMKAGCLGRPIQDQSIPICASCYSPMVKGIRTQVCPRCGSDLVAGTIHTDSKIETEDFEDCQTCDGLGFVLEHEGGKNPCPDCGGSGQQHTIHTTSEDPKLQTCEDCGHPLDKGGNCPARTYTHDCPPKK